MAATTLRRSKRIKKISESQETKTTDAEPAKTGGKTKSQISESASKYAAGTRGYLQQMTEIPLDTLHDILWHLDPMDLLSLSWANKNLNILIMERSARNIWKESFERLYESDNSPPRCPEELNLAQYARFLFHRKCMVCEKGDGRRVSWEMRLRACSKCLKGHHFIRKTFRDTYVYPTISDKDGAYYLTADIRAGAVKTPEERLEALESRREGEAVFLVWENNHLEDLRDLVRLNRQNTILARLEGLGWKESEITKMYGGGFPTDLAGFWLARELTDADWKKIRPKILYQLKAKREKLMKAKIHGNFPKRWQKFREKFDEWSKAQTMDSCLRPCISDIAVIEPFRSTLFESDAETAEFKLDDIDHVAKEWIESRNEFILSLLPPDLRERYCAEEFSTLLSSSTLGFFRGRGGYFLLRPVLEERTFYCDPSTLQPADRSIRRMLPGKMPWNWIKGYLKFEREYRGPRPRSCDYRSCFI